MRLFYDTEFLENGTTIDLISIGIIAENGQEYYAINQGMPFGPISRHQWLMANVMPSLPVRGGHSDPWDRAHPDFQHVKPRTQIADEVKHFIGQFTDPQLWAWYGAYDHVALAQLFGRMIDLPVGIPMFTNDLKQECERLGNPRLPEQAAGQHNALEDARHNLVMAKVLDEHAATTELAQLRAARDRTIDMMEQYKIAGSRGVHPRQVINLLSLTWPDGNYEETDRG